MKTWQSVARKQISRAIVQLKNDEVPSLNVGSCPVCAFVIEHHDVLDREVASGCGRWGFGPCPARDSCRQYSTIICEYAKLSPKNAIKYLRKLLESLKE